MKFRSLFLAILVTLGVAHAQVIGPASLGIASLISPNNVYVLDSSSTWALIGTVDPSTHVFSAVGGGSSGSSDITGNTLTVTGAIVGGSLSTGSGAIAGGTASVASVVSAGAISGSNITSTGPITATTSLNGATLVVSGAASTGTLTAGAITAPSLTASGAVSAGSLALSAAFSVPAIITTGSPPASSGTCAINTKVGGNTAGSFKQNGICSAGATVILTFATTAPVGWACTFTDMTAVSGSGSINSFLTQISYTTTTATSRVNNTTNADQFTYRCNAF